MEVRWTRSAATHIGTRSDRYPGGTDIREQWTREAAHDPHALVADPDPRSAAGAVRIVGYSPAAGFVVTVIAVRVDDELWGVTAWKTTGAERREYQEANRGEAN